MTSLKRLFLQVAESVADALMNEDNKLPNMEVGGSNSHEEFMGSSNRDNYERGSPLAPKLFCLHVKPALVQKIQNLHSQRAASRFFEAVCEDVHVLNRVGLSIDNMVQNMASSDGVGGSDSFAACYNLVLDALLDERVLSRELARLVATAGRAVISQSLDVSLPRATSEEFDEYISILHRHAHSPESLAREVLSGHG